MRVYSMIWMQLNFSCKIGSATYPDDRMTINYDTNKNASYKLTIKFNRNYNKLLR